MKLLYDFFPIAIFFIVYKLYGIYAATYVAIVVSFVQVVIHRLRHPTFDKMQVITLLLIAVLGGATVFFHNDIFIKWKPTILNWVFALVFAVSRVFTKKTIIQQLLEKEIQLPSSIWQRLNLAWVIFFVVVGFANLYVVYHFDTNIWVNFKLFGILGLTISFVILQSFYLTKFVNAANSQKETDNTAPKEKETL